MDNYLDDLNIEIIFSNGIIKDHLEELLYFKDITLPAYYKLFLEQTNGLIIESDYSVDEFNDPAHILFLQAQDLEFTSKKVNNMPNNRFILFATNEDNADYLFDSERVDPEGNPLILLCMPVEEFYIPLTNSFNVFLEATCLGILHHFEKFASNRHSPTINPKLRKKSDSILPCLKSIFMTAKREYQLLDIWHVPPKTKGLIQESMINWFKELKRLVSVFQ
ncbi:MAG: hypothetical protein GF308_08990 [Candidatus Heimdallarchaeota archaeon]|nr:hypothetical protein [Candidatus Heimdallarchaeota archaeon]